MNRKIKEVLGLKNPYMLVERNSRAIEEVIERTGLVPDGGFVMREGETDCDHYWHDRKEDGERTCLKCGRIESG